MNRNATLALAGVVLACATTAAFAAKPELTGQQKKALAAKVKENHKNDAPQPKTMAQSNATKLVDAASGAEGILIASDLWPTMYVQTDANGNKHVVETENGVAPTTTMEGAPNE